jgi:hypothetical protein
MTTTSEAHEPELHVQVVPVPYVLTPTQAARLLGRSRAWFYTFLRTPEAAPIMAGSRRIGGFRVFKTEAILRFIENAR